MSGYFLSMSAFRSAGVSGTVNQALANADHWSAIYNCTSFSAGLWNAVCSDTLCAGVPETPADLKADMLRK